MSSNAISSAFRRLRAPILLATLITLASLLTAAGAAAVVIQTPTGKRISITPKQTGLQSGALESLRVAPEPATTNGTAGTPSAMRTAGRATPSGTYNVVSHSSFADSHAYPTQYPLDASGCAEPPGSTYTTCISDGQVQAELQKVIAANPATLPGPGSSANQFTSTIYFIHLPPNIDACFSSGPAVGDPNTGTGNQCASNAFCAYHSSVNTASGPLYAVMPDADLTACRSGNEPNSNAADYTISVLSHEHIETITDPFLTGWVTSAGNEIGDLCVGAGGDVFGAPLGGSSGSEYNQNINGGHYFLQDEFADFDNGNSSFNSCEQRPGGNPDGVPSGNAPNGGTDHGPLLWQGGQVMDQQHTVVNIYWDPNSVFTTSYKTLLDKYLTDVAAASQDHTRTGTGLNVYDVGAKYGNLNAPTASFTGPASAKQSQPVTFDASASSDPNSSSLTYTWDFGDGTSTNTTQPTVMHAYRASGTHLVTLSVTDSLGAASQPTTQSIHILIPPTASFSFPAGTLYTGTPIAFDASASGGPDAPVTSYGWSFGDGGTANTVRASHTYSAASVYSVTLTVTDANGNVGTSTQQVTLVEPPIQPPNNNTARRVKASIAAHGRATAILRGRNVIVVTGRALTCPSGTSGCTTKVTLSARTTSHRRTRTVTVGTATVFTRAGHTSVLRVTLNGQGRSLLAHLRRLRLTARISATGTNLQSSTQVVTFSVAQPRRRRA